MPVRCCKASASPAVVVDMKITSGAAAIINSGSPPIEGPMTAFCLSPGWANKCVNTCSRDSCSSTPQIKPAPPAYVTKRIAEARMQTILRTVSGKATCRPKASFISREKVLCFPCPPQAQQHPKIRIQYKTFITASDKTSNS